MKPHRSKHLKVKAVRENSINTDVAANRQKEWENKTHTQRVSLLSVGEKITPFKDLLKPIDAAWAKFILNYYIKHWQREKKIHFENFHRSKRTTPGEVEGEGPYTVKPELPKNFHQRIQQKHSAKANDIDRKMIKIQNQHHKKAA